MKPIQRNGFSEADKVVKPPSPFSSSNSADDQSNWLLNFAFSFKQWFYYADFGYENDLKHVEDRLSTPVNYNSNPEGEKSKER